MAMDGLLLCNVTKKLQAFCPCKLNKIQNISEEEILFQLHTRNGNRKLVVNVHSNINRLYVAQHVEVGQTRPSNFVMVLRKQCAQAIVESIAQAHFDRVLCMQLSTRNEFGDYRPMKLYLELMGKYANMVLVDENNTIIDALKRIPVYENSKRFVHPGAKYSLPVQKEKQDPEHVTHLDPDQSLVDQIYGFSPLLSREFQYRMANHQSYADCLKELLTSDTLYVYPKDYHCIELTHLHQEAKTHPLMEGLNHLYEDRENKARIKEQCGDLIRFVRQEKRKSEKKLPKLENALDKSRDYRKYQEYGDLLFAYMGQIEKAPKITLPSFNDGTDVIIPIDMRYDIKTNANKFYQKYHKLKRSQSVLQEQIEQCHQDIAYFTQLEEQLFHANVEDAAEIREELIQKHILLPKKKIVRSRRKKRPNFLRLELEDASIFVGKNNMQNSYITHQLARKNDLWFHVKDYHGAHVLLKCETPDERLIRMCANLAAYFSKGKQSSSVPVDYCPVRQLKKVPGAPAGFVTMKSYKTIYIDPDESQIESWIQQYEKK